jgi:hypothetical protein
LLPLPPRFACGDSAQPRHVRTGAEAAAGAGQHDGAYGVVLRRLLDSIAHFFVHLTGPGVEFVRAIEGDGGDEILDAVEDFSIRHAFPPIIILTIAYCSVLVEENGNWRARWPITFASGRFAWSLLISRV